MKKKHLITVGQVESHMESNKILFASAPPIIHNGFHPPRKEFYYTAEGVYFVYHRGELILETIVLARAVELYNQY